MDLAFRGARLPPAPYPSAPPPPPTPEEIAAKKLKAKKESDASRRRKLIVASILIAVIVIGAAYYFEEDSSYATAVVSTDKATGSISGISDATVSLPNGNSAQPTTNPNARITVTVGSSSFTQFLACWPTPYKVGQSVSVTVMDLRNGNHAYNAALACRGGAVGGSTSTSTTSTKG